MGERTARFGEAVIRFCLKIKKTVVTGPLISQLVSVGTSVGANYCEADEAFSRKDFRHNIGVCKKEASESAFWLRMLAAADESSKEEGRVLYAEAQALRKIFASIFRKVDDV